MSLILLNAVAALGLVTETSDEEVAAEQLVVAFHALETRVLQAEAKLAGRPRPRKVSAWMPGWPRSEGNTRFSRWSDARHCWSSRNQSPKTLNPMDPFKSSPAPDQNCFTGNSPASDPKTNLTKVPAAPSPVPERGIIEQNRGHWPNGGIAPMPDGIIPGPGTPGAPLANRGMTVGQLRTVTKAAKAPRRVSKDV